MAPELHDQREYGPMVDVYAFGIVLWEIICTVRVFCHEFTLGVSSSFTPLLRLKRCHACDQ
jgi:hypothetical protein